MSKFKRVFDQWGGGVAAFFSYTHFSHDLAVSLIVPLLPLIREDLGLNYLELGVLVAAFTITSGLSQFPGGWIGDRLNRTMVVAIDLGAIGLAALAIGFSPSYSSLLFLLIIMGLFAGLYHPSAISMLSGHFREKKGRGLAFHMAAGNFGFALGPVLGGVIAGVLGWRFAYIILSLPAFIGLFLVLARMRKQRQSEISSKTSDMAIKPPPSAEPPVKAPGLGRVLRSVAVVATLAILMHLVANVAMAFVPIYLVDKHGIAPAYAAIWLGLTRGGGVVGTLFGGWLFDRWGKRRSILLALVATGPILYLLTKLEFGFAMATVLFLFGMVMLMRQATVQPFLMDSTPRHLRATILGIYFGLGMEGSSMFQPVAGHFMDIFGLTSVFDVIAIISIALSVSALLLVKQIKQRTTIIDSESVEV